MKTMEQWNFSWTERGRGSILWPPPAVHTPWAVLTWHPITQHPPTHHPPPPHYNPHHPFLQSSCVNPGVALPLGCGLPGTEADAAICEQDSLWNLLHTRAHAHMHTRTHAFQPYLSLCPLLSVPVSGVYLFIFTSPPSPSTACNKLTVALSTWHGPKLKWWAPPSPTFYFTPCNAASAWANTPTGIKLYQLDIQRVEGFRWTTLLKSRIQRYKEMQAVLGGYMNNGPIILLGYLVSCCWYRIMGHAVVLLNPFPLKTMMAVWLNASVFVWVLDNGTRGCGRYSVNLHVLTRGSSFCTVCS